MKKRLLIILAVAVLLVGCGNQQETTNSATDQPSTTESSSTIAPTSTPTEAPTGAETPAEAEEPTEPPHEHAYTEAITTDATCDADGLKTFTCECGDTYTEAIPATGHIYENYVSNNDATYTSDGTETAKCNTCDLTDTRTAEGSKLEYTYTEMNATMYATQNVNIRNLPSTDGEKIGSLSTNQEIAVIGQCNETGWYKFELDGQTAFVSNSYLSTEKVEVQQSTGGNSSGSGNSLANHFGITIPCTATYYSSSTSYGITWGNIWNSNTTFDPDSNFVGHIDNGTLVTISNLSGSKNDCMAYITLPNGTSGWVQFSYNGYNNFTW